VIGDLDFNMECFTMDGVDRWHVGLAKSEMVGWGQLGHHVFRLVGEECRWGHVTLGELFQGFCSGWWMS